MSSTDHSSLMTSEEKCQAVKMLSALSVVDLLKLLTKSGYVINRTTPKQKRNLIPLVMKRCKITITDEGQSYADQKAAVQLLMKVLDGVLTRNPETRYTMLRLLSLVGSIYGHNPTQKVVILPSDHLKEFKDFAQWAHASPKNPADVLDRFKRCFKVIDRSMMDELFGTIAVCASTSLGAIGVGGPDVEVGLSLGSIIGDACGHVIPGTDFNNEEFLMGKCPILPECLLVPEEPAPAPAPVVPPEGEPVAPVAPEEPVAPVAPVAPVVPEEPVAPVVPPEEEPDFQTELPTDHSENAVVIVASSADAWKEINDNAGSLLSPGTFRQIAQKDVKTTDWAKFRKMTGLKGRWKIYASTEVGDNPTPNSTLHYRDPHFVDASWQGAVAGTPPWDAQSLSTFIYGTIFIIPDHCP